MAIRRTIAEFSDDIATADIADDAVTGGKLANDIAISTTGNIATTGSGTLAVAGTSTLTGNATAAGNLTVTGDIVPSTPLSHRNLVINGAMQVSQRGTSEASISGNTTGYKNGPDRMWFGMRAAGTYTISQSTESPEGFSNSYKFDNTTADASLDANSYLQLSTRFEGQDLQHLKYGTANAETTTLSFYVRSNLTGIFPVELEGTESTNRHIAKTYTINSANTWERKEVTFAGDTSVASDNDNGGAISIIWWLASGTNYTSGTLASSWQNMDSADRAVGIANNLGSSTSNDFHITGIQWELGSNATPFEHRSFGDEELRCMRYYVKFGNTGWMACAGSGSNYVNGARIALGVPMRDDPDISLTGSILNQVDSANTYTTSSSGYSIFGEAVRANYITFNANGLAANSTVDNRPGIMLFGAGELSAEL